MNVIKTNILEKFEFLEDTRMMKPPMAFEIVYASEKYFKSFHEALDSVARERIYIEMVEAKPVVFITVIHPQCRI